MTSHTVVGYMSRGSWVMANEKSDGLGARNHQASSAFMCHYIVKTVGLVDLQTCFTSFLTK